MVSNIVKTHTHTHTNIKNPPDCGILLDIKIQTIKNQTQVNPIIFCAVLL